MKVPCISIAMTTYNGEKYLREQLDSILRQSFTDWELVICDDCSKDSTRQILAEYAGKDNRIKIFENDKNLGFKKNFEKAISLCNGDYIALSDQDDIWLPQHLQILLNIIGNKSASFGNSLLVDANNKSLNRMLNEIDGFNWLPPENKILWHILFIHGPFQGAAALFKSSFVKRLLPIPEGCLYHDAWFASCACMEDGIAYTFEPILRYRQHGNNVTAESHKIKKSKIHRWKTFINALTGKKKLYTDRFNYNNELFNKYGSANKDFKIIYKLIEHFRTKHVSIGDIFILWKKYKYINATEKGHKNFIKNLLIWKFWDEEKIQNE